MLAWVLNAPLLFKDSLNVLFLSSILRFNTLQIYYFFRLLLLIHQIKHAVLILINIISLTRTKTLVNNNLEYKLRTSE